MKAASEIVIARSAVVNSRIPRRGGLRARPIHGRSRSAATFELIGLHHQAGDTPCCPATDAIASVQPDKHDELPAATHDHSLPIEVFVDDPRIVDVRSETP